MKWILRILQLLYVTYAFICFFLLMIIVFLLSLTLPLCKPVKQANILYILCRCWARIWLTVIGIKHKIIFEYTHHKKRSYVFVANHNSYMDIVQIMMAIQQPLRILGKAEMARVPIFGYIYKNATIMVDRRNAETRARSLKKLLEVVKQGISIFLFPEGTFNEDPTKPLKNFYDGAFKIAIETQTPIKPIIFPDAVNRLHYRHITALTPGKLRTIYLQEIPVNDYTINDVALLKQHVKEVMEKALRRYKKYFDN